MSLATPDKIRELQIKLYRKAKNEPEFRFHQLYDKVYREDILIHAYMLAKSNEGAPAVDGESFDRLADLPCRGKVRGVWPIPGRWTQPCLSNGFLNKGSFLWSSNYDAL